MGKNRWRLVKFGEPKIIIERKKCCVFYWTNLLHLLHKINFYRVPSKETQWVLFEFVCEKSLIAKHLMISRTRIRIILTKFLSGEHGSKLSKDLVHLQNIYFPPNFFICFLEKEISAGKKFTLQMRLFDYLNSVCWKVLVYGSVQLACCVNRT